MFGSRGRIGLIIPANNATIEPELWSRLPPGTAAYATRIAIKGDLTAAAVHAMERHFDRAVDDLTATGVDVLVYADMVTTFVMPPSWNANRTAAVTERTGIACLSAWTALQAALEALAVRRIALGTPYPRAIHALVPAFFAAAGYDIVRDATLDILATSEVPKVSGGRLCRFALDLSAPGAEAIVLLATDLPTFAEIERIERETGLPVLSSNQTILWRALRACGNAEVIPALGRLLRDR